MEMAAAARSWREERKLLHWINSLPPPACLLVEALTDLRFGDVLLAIIRWLQAQQRQLEATPTLEPDDDNVTPTSTRLEMSCDASVKRLRRVLLFVAREARSEDGDALFMVNEAQCAERIQSGDVDTICAVLRVLKRVGDRLADKQQQEGDDDDRESRSQHQRDRAVITTELLRLNAVREDTGTTSSDGKVKRCKRDLRIVGLSSDRFRDASCADSCSQAPVRKGTSRSSPALARMRGATQPPVKPPKSGGGSSSRSDKVVAGVGLKKQASRKPKTTTRRQVLLATDEEPKIPMYRDSKGQLHVYSMVDPSTRKRAAHTLHSSTLTDVTANEENQVERRVHAWMDLLGVGLQGKHQSLASKQSAQVNPTTIFQDGVVLCQIAAGVVKKYGDGIEKQSLETFVDESSDRVVLLPQDATLCPQNAAQRRRNVAIAVEILTKFCGMQCSSNRSQENNNIRAKLVTFFTANRRESQRERADDSIWELLDHVHVGIEASRSRVVATDAVSSPMQTTDKTLLDTAALTIGENSREIDVDENSHVGVNAPLECAPPVHQGEKRRPYITSEQMQAVNRWLKGVDKDMMMEVRTLIPCSLSARRSPFMLRCRTTVEQRQEPLPGSVAQWRAPVVRGEKCQNTTCKQQFSSLTFIDVFPHSNLYARAFAHPKEPPLRFAKAPKTLAEVRYDMIWRARERRLDSKQT